MSLLTQLLHTRLVEDATLVSMVDEYRGQPSIISSPEIPEDLKGKYIRILQSDTDNPDETKLSRGRRITRQVWFVGPNTGSWNELETMALRGRALLHRKPLNGTSSEGDVKGYIAECQGPVPIPSDQSVIGLALTLDLRYTE